ncbi:carboxypeptidase-like regulatory domain-containing protein [Sphingobacterium sp. BIGb0165]|uniref:TonB-dependent receptor n=1 Tax=Sphingobacterium sp. BIGb0165 TaxID=2940615 RepID=UPI0021694032|nr:carboxypeptidase-like regulatory domain-containing protein [Sphingobacterium sp. BIGb0165]MCS4226347.1 hypothetical protein [Sphingobacterium sp. BIGb0165]
MNKCLLFLICGLCILFSRAQAQVSVQGEVTSNGQPVGSARVELRLSKGAGLLGYTFTDGAGRYRLAVKQQGTQILYFQALSYVPVERTIDIGTTDTTVNVQLIAGGVERLAEVLVHAKRPYRLGRDTIELSAKSFLQGDERTVEDLLKKIPGLNVGTDGSIKIGNKEVEKVMVEGDDLFEKGYRLLTQNMSVQPVDKIQILQRYSNNKHLKGVENSDKIALNIQLKADSRNQWVGSAAVSAAPVGKQYYQASASLMNFGKKNKYYLLGAANNNGFDAVSSINHLLYPNQTDEPGQIGAGVVTPTLIDNMPDFPDFDYKRTNFNRDKLLSFNTILNPTKKLKVKWLGFINPTKKSFYRNSIQDYHIEDLQFTNTENYEFNRNINNYFSKWELQYDLNQKSTLTYSGNLGSLHKQDVGNLSFNGIGSTELTASKGNLTNHNMSYTHKFSERDVLVSSARWIRQRSPVDYSIDQYYYEDLFQVGDIAAVTQHIENKLDYIGFTSHYVRRSKNGNFMEVALLNEYKVQQLETELALNRENDPPVHPVGFSNQIDLRTNQMGIIAKYSIKHGKWEWTPKLQAWYLHSSLDRAGNSQNRNNGLISPSISGKWMIYPKGKLEGQLSFQQKNTELVDVTSNYYSTGLRSFVKGLDNMATLSSSDGLLTYTHGSMMDKFYANLSIGYTSMFDYFSNQNDIGVNYNLSEKILLKDRKDRFYKLQLNYYLKTLNGNIRLDIGGNSSAYQATVVGVGARQIRLFSQEYALSFRSAWKSRLNIYTGYSVQSTAYTSERKDQLKNTKAFMNVFLNMGKGLQASLKNESYRFGDFLGTDAKTYYFSDFAVFYDAKKIKTRFDITAKNILNTRQFRNAVVTDTYRSITEYRLLPRYIAIGAEYSF